MTSEKVTDFSASVEMAKEYGLPQALRAFAMTGTESTDFSAPVEMTRRCGE